MVPKSQYVAKYAAKHLFLCYFCFLGRLNVVLVKYSSTTFNWHWQSGDFDIAGKIFISQHLAQMMEVFGYRALGLSLQGKYSGKRTAIYQLSKCSVSHLVCPGNIFWTWLQLIFELSFLPSLIYSTVRYENDPLCQNWSFSLTCCRLSP